MTNEVIQIAEPIINLTLPKVTLENEKYLNEALDSYLSQFKVEDGQEFVSTKESYSTDKKIGTEINKVIKLLTSKRIDVDKQIKSSADEFDNSIKSMVEKAETVRSAFVNATKKFDENLEKQKHEKNIILIAAAAEQYDLDPSVVEYNPKWDKKSFSENKMIEEVDRILDFAKHQKDEKEANIKTIKMQAQTLNLWPDSFIDDLDRGFTLPDIMTRMSKAHEQKVADEERVRKLNEAKRAAEQAEQEAVQEVYDNKVINKETGEVVDKIVEVAFTVKTTQTKLKQLQEFLIENKIEYR